MINKKWNKLISFCLTLIMVFSIISPYGVLASEGQGDGSGKITLSIDKLTIDKGYVLSPTEVDFYDGESVWDVFQRVMDDHDISYEYTYFDIYDSVYVEWIDGDGEFDHGPGSGWMYNVNGWYPNYGASQYKLKDGDRVEWRYTTNLGEDLGEDLSKWEDPPLEQDEVDKTALQSAIEAAELNKASAKVSVDGTDIDPSEYWVTEAVVAAYVAEIVSAQALVADENAIQDTVDAKVLALNQATTTFNNAKQIGTKSEKANIVKQQLTKNLAYLHETVDNPSFGTLGGEWSVLTLARGEYEVSDGYYETYYQNVVNEVKRLMPQSGSKPEGRLDRNKGTEHSRAILGLTSIGKDITNVGGYDLREALADFNYVTRQGINGPIFALIAFDSHNYEIPVIEGVVEQTTREKKISYILDKEIGKGTANAGGWALSGTNPDPDITAMAIQGLTPYYKTNSDVKAAVDRALVWLSSAQKEDGGYASWGSINSESCAQVIVALTGLGIDPHTDSRFIKNGKSVVDALMGFAVPEGGFKHIASGKVDGMATDQGTYALVAYSRFLDGKTSLYNMTDVEIDAGKATTEPSVIQVPEGDADYTIPADILDNKAKLEIQIPSNHQAKTFIELPVNTSLPEIVVNKGNISVEFAKGSMLTSSNAAPIELITTKDHNDTTFKNKINSIIDRNKETAKIYAALSMGGGDRLDFDQYVTITFSGMKGKDVAYIQSEQIYPIKKYANDVKGLASNKSEYAYDDGKDLIVKTKHFTDFILYSKQSKTSSNGGGSSSSGIGESGKNEIILSIDKHTINKGYVLSPVKVEFSIGETVWDVLKRELDKRGIDYSYSYFEIYDSVYVESIAGDGEFDHGSGSGWMYNVNDWYPNYGASQYKLKNGDRVEWRYTTNLGADLGEDLSKWEEPKKSPSSGGGGSAKSDEKKQGIETPKNNEKSSLAKIYTDVKLISPWAHDFIDEATKKGFIEGYAGKINPKSNVTRAEFTKLMVSVLGLDIKMDRVSNFTDVKPGDWFYPYVNTAYNEKIVQGFDGKFLPNDNITREEMAVMIVRALNLKHAGSTDSLKDNHKISPWAKLAVGTLVSSKLMEGYDNKFNPRDLSTREMAIVVAMRANHYDPKKANEDTTKANSNVSKIIKETASFMQEAVTDPIVASVGGEWTVFGLARSGENVPNSYYDKYYATVEKTLKEKFGVLHSIKYTEYDRVILALTAIGKDVKNVAGYDLREPLADFNKVIVQGINGPIFALIALDSKNYEIPVVQGVEVQTTREKLIDFILSREINGGGWALGQNPPEADPDITAMAIQGLTPYYETNEKVKKAVDRGINWLSGVQQNDGGYKSWGSLNSESVAQVIVALTGLGIDPHTDKRFVKNGKSALDSLLSFAAPGGGFYHVKAGEQGNGGAEPGQVDLMATDQAMYALVAYDRFLKDKNRLYDMTDVR